MKPALKSIDWKLRKEKKCLELLVQSAYFLVEAPFQLFQISGIVRFFYSKVAMKLTSPCVIRAWRLKPPEFAKPWLINCAGSPKE